MNTAVRKYKSHEAAHPIKPWRVKARRQARGLQQKEVAEMIGVSGALMCRIENPKSTQPIRQTTVLLDLARALHTTPEYLVGLTDDPAPVGYKTTEEGIEVELAVTDLMARNPQTPQEIDDMIDALIPFLVRKNAKHLDKFKCAVAKVEQQIQSHPSQPA